MSIKEVMKLGTDGMNTAQRQEEKERRVKVVERINIIGEKIARTDEKPKKNEYLRQLRKIKSEESSWLKDAAWFMYA